MTPTCSTCLKPRPTEAESATHNHDGRGCVEVGCSFFAERCWTGEDEEAPSAEHVREGLDYWKARAERAEAALLEARRTGLPRLWLLKRREDPADVAYDETVGMVVRALSAHQAREIASKEARDEGAEVWRDPQRTVCTELGLSGPHGLILHDFKAG